MTKKEILKENMEEIDIKICLKKVINDSKNIKKIIVKKKIIKV